MENEALIRLVVFLGLFSVLAVIRGFGPAPCTQPEAQPALGDELGHHNRQHRLAAPHAIALPFLAVGAALDAQAQGWGLFNALMLPVWIEVVAAMLILDLAIWAQHLITHKIPILWRLHRVHHADVDMDVTTAIRFHPVKIGLSMLLKIGAVYLLGPAALAVILFEIILNGTAMFNHANIRVPLWLDASVRKVLVTPDMHRVHHSVHRHEHDSNYGFALSIWDRMFGTYIAQPAAGHDDMEVGLEWQDERSARLGWVLSLPFARK